MDILWNIREQRIRKINEYKSTKKALTFQSRPLYIVCNFLSPSAVSPHSGYLSASASFLSASGLFPLAFALGSGYLALGCLLFRFFPAASFLFLSAASRIPAHVFSFVNNFFDIFLMFFYSTLSGSSALPNASPNSTIRSATLFSISVPHSGFAFGGASFLNPCASQPLSVMSLISRGI